MPVKTLILLFSCLACLIAGGRWFFLNIGDLLSTSDTLQQADVIVCLSHDKSRIETAADLFRQGYGNKIIATTDLTIESLIKNNIARSNIVMLDPPADNTYEEALFVTALLDRSAYHSAIIISEPIHLYRVRWSFNHLLSDSVTKRIFICSDPSWAEGSWWQNSAKRRYVFNEISKILYYWTVHGLLGIKSDPEWVKKLQYWYHRMLNTFAPSR